MNTKRFINYGKYDFAINRVFYRNMFIMALGMAMGVCALCFLGRWVAYHDVLEPIEQTTAGQHDVYIHSINNVAHYSYTPITQALLMLVVSMLPIIFAGCSFHCFRKKQGRIAELTLPATNKEKFGWHLLVSIVGGIAVSIFSLLCADLLNFLLHLVVYGTEDTYSLTVRIFQQMTLTLPNMKVHDVDLALVNSFLSATRVFMVGNLIWQLCAYIYGNSIKYKYNIILTYVILLAINIVGFLIAMSIFTGIYDVKDMSGKEAMGHVINWFWIIGIASIMLGALLMWRSYKRYCNAQLTTLTNK